MYLPECEDVWGNALIIWSQLLLMIESSIGIKEFDWKMMCCNGFFNGQRTALQVDEEWEIFDYDLTAMSEAIDIGRSD